MYDFVLFLHMASAASWIGGAMLLFILGITLRDKEVQKKVYYHIGPPYGYFESVVLVILWVTGIYMYMTNGFHDNPERFAGTQLGTIMHIKIALVVLITLATIVHMKVSLEANGREKSTKEKFLARGTSMMIFLLNFVILWLAMQVRDVL
jgi:putative copper export protein